ncbi:MAG: c-type cytochrome [Candidatus Latescibacteria bacterium]|nr:c-type cytochrome [Candidatus Latescibacterota bacterium]
MRSPLLPLGVGAGVLLAGWQASLAAQPLPATPQLVEKGKQTYQQLCAPCHGATGQGDGAAAYLLYPKPRNFAKAQYRLVSTWEQVPTDEDLFSVITRGMPGSAMPSWPNLSEETRWGLVHYLKTFSDHPLEITPPTPPPTEGGPGTGVIEVPLEPIYDEAAQQHAAELFAQGCAGCHGATGKGDGQTRQIDSDGYPTRPRDLTRGIYKGEPSPQSVYRRIVAGLPGTPMPMSDWAPGADAWALTRYVLAMSSPRQRQRNEMLRFTIEAPRVAQLPSHPDDGEWRLASPVNLHLMPLWWRDDRIEEVTVRALHDGGELAVLLEWHDDTYDHTAIRPQDFRDAAAVQFSLSADPPFFGMGALGQMVNIWMWKSERQADLVAFQDLEAVYPNIGIDSYPNLLKSPLEQPMRHALTLESDPTYVTGWGAGNIVSDPTRRNAAEDLQAQGQGTLKAHPRFDQEVVAEGVYQSNSYHVVFRRALKPKGKEGVVLKSGATVPVAFAVWNGSQGDRDGKKSVTIWQELKLAP